MPRLVCPSWRWMTISGTPSRAISTAWAWRSWWGAKRRRTPARAAVWRKLLAGRGRRPAAAPGRAGEHAQQRADGQPDADVQPLLELLPGPVVHADFPAATALASADEDCAAAGVKVGLGERERFVDAQPGSPQHDDQSAHPQAVGRGAGLAHDGDYLLDGGRIRGIAAAFVAGGRPEWKPGIVAGDRRWPAASSSTEDMTRS